jgi:hypothetical protein
MDHVNGSGSKQMSFANFSTSRIKRGRHVSYSGNDPFFSGENMLLNQFGIMKSEGTVKVRAKCSYTLTDGKNQVKVYAEEKELTRHLVYQRINRTDLFSSYDQLQQYNYLFSAIISTDTTQNSKNWVLQMTNFYDRAAERDNNPLAHRKLGDNGIVTNGTDTIFIKPVKIEKTVMPNGKEAQIPFKLLGGYELSTPDGVIAIIDMIDQNIWFYNGLDAAEKLNISAIATAIFARKIHDEKWDNHKRGS